MSRVCMGSRSQLRLQHMQVRVCVRHPWAPSRSGSQVDGHHATMDLYMHGPLTLKHRSVRRTEEDMARQPGMNCVAASSPAGWSYLLLLTSRRPSELNWQPCSTVRMYTVRSRSPESW